jgi:hypothetical protein
MTHTLRRLRLQLFGKSVDVLSLGWDSPAEFRPGDSVYVRFVWHDVFVARVFDAEFEGRFSHLKASA